MKKGIARRAVEALDGGDALGFVAGCGAKKARAAPTLAHVFVEAPSLKALFPGVDAARAPEINSAHMILRNTPRNRELAEAFLGGLASVETCVEIKILRCVRAESSRRPPRHRRNACSMAWRCRFVTARPSQDGRVIAEK